MLSRYPPLKPTPEEFEKCVKEILDGMGVDLREYQSNHREVVGGSDGEYEIDIMVRFSALGLSYVTLVECKRHNSAIKREVVQSLWAKLLSVGAQKGLVFSTSGFQSGAIEFATAHGIALVQLCDGRSCYFTRSAGSASETLDWDRVPDCIPKIVGWLTQGKSITIVTPDEARRLAEALGLAERN